MKRPLVSLTFAFCLGIFAASRINAPFIWVYSLAAIFLGLSLILARGKLPCSTFLFLLALLLGMLSFQNSQILPRCHISHYVYYKDSNLYRITGFVISEPSEKFNRTLFIFKVKGLNGIYCCGDIFVRVRGKQDFKYGEELILAGNLYRPYKFNNFYRQGDVIMNVKSSSHIIRLNKNCGFFLKRFALRLKDKFAEAIFKHVSPVAAGILEAMVLGEKRYVPPLIYNSMVKSGTVHILVVSGFNVGIVGFIIVLLLKLIRIHRRARFYFAVPLLIVYCLMTGASTPVVRATVMAIVFMFGYLAKRETDIYNSCSLAAMLILGSDPNQLFDIGFQLSFASVISIAYLYPKAKSLLRVESLEIKYARFFLEGCLVSFSAWLGTMGLVAYHFKFFSPITVLANIFIVPLATLITLCGFSLIAAGFICPYITYLFAYTCELLVKFLLGINAFMLKLPAAYFRLP